MILRHWQFLHAGVCGLAVIWAQAAISQTQTASAVFLDATTTHVPRADKLNALDAEFVDVDKDGDLYVVLAF